MNAVVDRFAIDPGVVAAPCAGHRAAGATVPAAFGADALAWGRTHRLALREFDARDHDDVLRMHRDARLRAHLIDDYPLDDSRVVAVFLERIRHIYRQHEGLGIWHASHAGTDGCARFAGWFNLMPMAERPGEVEIGSRLLPSAWGGALAVEGGELMLDHALADLDLARVWGICHPDNRSAQAVLATLGFRPLGVMPYDGGPAAHFQIEMNDWRSLRNIPRAARMRRALRAGNLPDRTR
jgi:RimJ/RimL family protein N-acetyltransferase